MLEDTASIPTNQITSALQVTWSAGSDLLSDLKAAANVFKLMKDHDFYLNKHRWSETDWETTQLGFCTESIRSFTTLIKQLPKLPIH
jgi:hypothetical protein